MGQVTNGLKGGFLVTNTEDDTVEFLEGGNSTLFYLYESGMLEATDALDELHTKDDIKHILLPKCQLADVIIRIGKRLESMDAKEKAMLKLTNQTSKGDYLLKILNEVSGGIEVEQLQYTSYAGVYIRVRYGLKGHGYYIDYDISEDWNTITLRKIVGAEVKGVEIVEILNSGKAVNLNDFSFLVDRNPVMTLGQTIREIRKVLPLNIRVKDLDIGMMYVPDYTKESSFDEDKAFTKIPNKSKYIFVLPKTDELDGGYLMLGYKDLVELLLYDTESNMLIPRSIIPRQKVNEYDAVWLKKEVLYKKKGR
jgi:hypothetical protein